MEKKRILIVDDSHLVQKVISRVIDSHPMLEVAGTAANGRIALDMIAEISPDLVTLDILMPEMDGLQTLIELRKRWPDIRTIMISSLTDRGTDAALDALAIGANDYVIKPGSSGGVVGYSEQLSKDLLPKIIALCGIEQNWKKPNHSREIKSSVTDLQARLRSPDKQRFEILAIGVSTGGPDALAKILPKLPADFAVPIVIVQHMPAGFTEKLAQRLNTSVSLTVKEAQVGDKVRAGTIYIAPGDYHMVLDRIDDEVLITLNQDPQVNSCRPAVDTLFKSVADVYGSAALAVVMTGMGRDGFAGAELLTKAGSTILVQDKASSIVWGMPGLIANAGLATEVIPLDKIVHTISGYICSSHKSGCVWSGRLAERCLLRPTGAITVRQGGRK
jgi:two-component system chemotaxis response regulator CheB